MVLACLVCRLPKASKFRGDVWCGTPVLSTGEVLAGEGRAPGSLPLVRMDLPLQPLNDKPEVFPAF